MGNIPFTTNADALKELFAAYGTIESVSIPMSGKRMKGYAFIKYATREEAEEAVETMHEKELDGRQLKVNFSSGAATDKSAKKKENAAGGEGGQQSGDKPKSSTIFIGNLSYSTNE